MVKNNPLVLECRTECSIDHLPVLYMWKKNGEKVGDGQTFHVGSGDRYQVLEDCAGERDRYTCKVIYRRFQDDVPLITYLESPSVCK